MSVKLEQIKSLIEQVRNLDITPMSCINKIDDLLEDLGEGGRTCPKIQLPE